jgi:hypothetical protein
MKSSLKDLPIKSEDAQKVSRVTEWGGMVVNVKPHAVAFKTISLVPCLRH